jgi:hypothetical protein
MKIVLVYVVYGLMYYVFEAMFNFITIDVINSKKTWKEKMRLITSVAPSFWMIPVGSIVGLLLYLFFLIPFDMTKIYILLPVCLLGGIMITAAELGSGVLLNIKLKLKLWDYSASKIVIGGKTIPLNYLGQIDIYRSLGWCALTWLIYYINFLFKY